LVRTLYHVTRPDASPDVRDFIAFIGSEEAAGILASTGNVVVTPRP
jgi:accessory colonization factor AcfC